MHYGDARFAKDFKAKGAVQEFMTLQFGGSGDDGIRDIQKLSTGELVVLVYTFSTTFAGIDASSYTDGSTYPAWGILKINPKLPPSNFIVGSYWLKGDAKTMGSIARCRIYVDANDYILYSWGEYVTAPFNDWKIYGVRSSDMTLQLTSDTAITVSTYAWYGAYITFSHYAGNTYVWYTAGGAYSYVQKLNSTLQQTASSTYISGVYPINSYTDANGTYCLFNDMTFHQAALADLSPITSTDLSAKLGASWPVIAGNGSTSIYFSDTKTGDNNMLVTAAGVGGWSDYEKSIDSGKAIRNTGLVVDSDGKLLSVGYSNNTGAVGTQDLEMQEINPATGTIVTDNWVTYRDATRCGQSGKTFQAPCPPLRIGANKYVLGIKTDGNFNGFSNLGSYDCALIKVDSTGKILG